MYPGYALSSHITKTQISEHLCTLATADKRHITQNTNQQNLMYPCKRTQQSHYTKHKSANPYVPLPPPTAVILHKTQISKHLCTLATANTITITQISNPLFTLATAHNSHITKNTNQQTLMYPCQSTQQSHYTKHNSAIPYVPLPQTTPVTLQKTQISKSLCTLATAHDSHITQITNQQTIMYPCHDPKQSHYTNLISANTLVPL